MIERDPLAYGLGRDSRHLGKRFVALVVADDEGDVAGLGLTPRRKEPQPEREEGRRFGWSVSSRGRRYHSGRRCLSRSYSGPASPCPTA